MLTDTAGDKQSPQKTQKPVSREFNEESIIESVSLSKISMEREDTKNKDEVINLVISKSHIPVQQLNKTDANFSRQLLHVLSCKQVQLPPLIPSPKGPNRKVT